MTMTYIATATASGGVVQFLNIPQNFNHLQIRAFIKTTFNGGENLYMRFNGTTYSFYGHSIYGNGASAASGGYSTAISYMDLNSIANASISTNIFGAYIIDILDYSSTIKNKTVKSIGGYDTNGGGYAQMSSGFFTSTAAITSISEIGGTAGSGLVSGTRFDLYGFNSSDQTGA